MNQDEKAGKKGDWFLPWMMRIIIIITIITSLSSSSVYASFQIRTYLKTSQTQKLRLLILYQVPTKLQGLCVLKPVC